MNLMSQNKKQVTLTRKKQPPVDKKSINLTPIKKKVMVRLTPKKRKKVHFLNHLA